MKSGFFTSEFWKSLLVVLAGAAMAVLPEFASHAAEGITAAKPEWAPLVQAAGLIIAAWKAHDYQKARGALKLAAMSADIAKIASNGAL